MRYDLKKFDTEIDPYKGNSFRSLGILHRIDSFLTKRTPLYIEYDSQYEML